MLLPLGRGGKSMAPFDSLNMGFNVGDDQGLVLDNHQLVAEALEFKTSQVVRGEQVHGLNIEVVDKKKQGGLLDKAKILCKTDGLITSVPNIMLASYYADCVPIMVLDKVAKNIGLFHAGWRGTVKKIALKGILAMKNYLGTNPKDCLAVIAPSIGPCCYQVDSLVKKEFQNNYQNYLSLFTEDGNEKWKLNL